MREYMRVNHPRKFWAVVETEHRSEFAARRSALAIGVECPLLAFRARAERGIRRITPLFDGYVLVRLDRRAGWAGLSSAKGVRSLLRGAGGEVEDAVGVVPSAEVDFLLGLVQSDGYVHLPEHDPLAFALGQFVRATAGCLADTIGEYGGPDPRDARRSMFVTTLMSRRVAQSILRYHLAPLGQRRPALLA